MTFTTDLLTNNAYGYPPGGLRRVAPIALCCLHITDNPGKPPATAQQERNLANTPGRLGPSAHTYINRDGSGVHAILTGYAAWSNGAINDYALTVPGVQAIVTFAKTWNPNEAYFHEIECCGNASYPITNAQKESIAALIAEGSIGTGIPISRATVHLHSDINRALRANDPVPLAQAETFAAGIIARAKVIKAALVEVSMDWDQLLAALDAKYKALVLERDTLKTQLAEADDLVDTLATRIEAMKAKALTIATLAGEMQT